MWGNSRGILRGVEEKNTDKNEKSKNWLSILKSLAGQALNVVLES